MLGIWLETVMTIKCTQTCVHVVAQAGRQHLKKNSIKLTNINFQNSNFNSVGKKI